MKTEQAIKLLHRLQDEQFDGIHGDERREALEMAVKALEGDRDTIYRQQAIDAVVSAMIDGADAELVEGVMEQLPSAQPEVLACGSGELVQESDSLVKDLVKDCISRKMAIDAFEPEHDTDWYTPRIIEVLEALPPAQPERKKGMWIKLDMHAHIADHKCTACGQECYVPTCMGEPMYTYCPNCGADMRTEGNDDD